jgi:ABC-2 type transport system permease protein
MAFSLALVVAGDGEIQFIRRHAPSALLAMFVYWQVAPIIMASAGLSLDLSRLIVYPIPHTQLFTIEVLLRISACIEMLLITFGLMAGLWMNDRVPLWSPLVLIPFAALNLFLSTAIRDLLSRLLARRGIRELMMFLFVLLAALPQVLMVAGPSGVRFGSPSAWAVGVHTPWGATGQLACGSFSGIAIGSLTAWTLVFWYLGRRQFERSLRFDAAAARSSQVLPTGRVRLLDWVVQLPRLVFRDPLAVLVEKEIRLLSRSARFRLLFFMGFSFGLLIWLPLAMQASDDSAIRGNYLTIVSAYALMLIGEVCFWNNFGMDRAAVQTYFAMPVRLSTVLIAKNIAASFFIFLEITLVAAVCFALRMPLSAEQILESYAVTVVLTVFLFAMGNMLSARYPRAVDPNQSWRNASMGRVQAFLLFLYPVASAPIFLAYMAHYAFDTRWAFYGVLVLDLMIGVVIYFIALESAIGAAERGKEEMMQVLASGQSPVSS